MIREILEETSLTDSLKEVEDYLLILTKPKGYGGKDGEEVRLMKGFEQTCILLRQQVGGEPKRWTVIEYFQALETLKEQHKAANKNKRR